MEIIKGVYPYNVLLFIKFRYFYLDYWYVFDRMTWRIFIELFFIAKCRMFHFIVCIPISTE
jgi:hypothetical protein